MSWRWTQRIRLGGGLRATLSQGGVGWSWGIPGLRFGISPRGQKWVSIGFPGLGLYFIKYLGRASTARDPTRDEPPSLPNAADERSIRWRDLRMQKDRLPPT